MADISQEARPTDSSDTRPEPGTLSLASLWDLGHSR